MDFIKTVFLGPKNHPISGLPVNIYFLPAKGDLDILPSIVFRPLQHQWVQHCWNQTWFSLSRRVPYQYKKIVSVMLSSRPGTSLLYLLMSNKFIRCFHHSWIFLSLRAQLTLLQPGGQIMPTTLLLAHPDLKSQRQLCVFAELPKAPSTLRGVWEARTFNPMTLPYQLILPPFLITQPCLSMSVRL